MKEPDTLAAAVSDHAQAARPPRLILYGKGQAVLVPKGGVGTAIEGPLVRQGCHDVEHGTNVQT